MQREGAREGKRTEKGRERGLGKYKIGEENGRERGEDVKGSTI